MTNNGYPVIKEQVTNGSKASNHLMSTKSGTLGTNNKSDLNDKLKSSSSSTLVKYPHLYEIMRQSGGLGSMIFPAIGQSFGNSDPNSTIKYDFNDFALIAKPTAMVIFIFGGPGSFKSEIITNLLDMFGFHYISANDIILEHLLVGMDSHLLPSELKEHAENCPQQFSLNKTLGFVTTIIKTTLNQLEGVMYEKRYKGQGNRGKAVKKLAQNVYFLVDIMPCLKFLPNGSDYFVDPGPDLKEFEQLYPINLAISLNISSNKIATFVTESKMAKRKSLSRTKKMSKNSTSSTTLNLKTISPKVKFSPEIKNAAGPSVDEDSGDELAQVSDEEEKCRLKRRIFKYQQNSEDFLEYFRSSSRLMLFDVSQHDFVNIWRKVRTFFISYQGYALDLSLSDNSGTSKGHLKQNSSTSKTHALIPSVKNAQQIHDKLLSNLSTYISKNCIHTQEVFLIECWKSSLINAQDYISKRPTDQGHKVTLFLEHTQSPIKLSEIVFKSLQGSGGSGKRQLIAHLVAMHKRALNVKFFAVEASQNITCYYQFGTTPLLYKWITEKTSFYLNEETPKNDLS